jgi:SEC-C motif
MSKHADTAGRGKTSWRSGRLARTRAAQSDATDAEYGVTKPDVIGDFLGERALDGTFGDRDEECPCGSGESYWRCHGSSIPPGMPPG